MNINILDKNDTWKIHEDKLLEEVGECIVEMKTLELLGDRQGKIKDKDTY